MSEAMTVQRAEALAREDAAEVIAAAGAECAAPNSSLHDPECMGAVLVDGSMFSPSWRALSGGAAVWEVWQPGYPDESFTAAYLETLDRLTDDWSGPGDEFLGWEDGTLFVFAADYCDD